jgi:hypothetical protein
LAEISARAAHIVAAYDIAAQGART